ncbi:MAG: hypothetical protein KGY54_06805 [Oleiphilaceae bacterium]|nr:hypothetical protein [Oleiphilaceae bacterium]
MKKYLQNIRQGRPINYQAFLKKLPPDIALRHRDCFSIERVSGQRWQVRCLDSAVMNRLEALAEVPENRQQAANQGDSHRQVTRAAFMLTYHSELTDERPDVVYLSAGICRQPFTAKPRVLVVENEDNFSAPDAILGFAGDCLGKPLSLANCDLVLGGGNRVNRPLVADWLGSYQEVYCAFDYDLGGLKMFASLKGRLGDPAIFVQPPDWQPWASAFTCSPKTGDRLKAAIEMANRLGFAQLAQMFVLTRQFMEQEMILNEY